MFFCFKCGENFIKVKTLVVHLKLLHAENWICGQSKCGRVFANSSELSRHLNIAHPQGSNHSNVSSISDSNVNQSSQLSEGEQSCNVSSPLASQELPVDSISIDTIDTILNKYILDFTMSLYETSNLNRKHVATVLQKLEGLLNPIIKCLLPDSRSVAILSSLKNILDIVGNENKLINLLSAKSEFIKPEQFVINKSVEKIQKNYKIQYSRNEIKGAFVPFHHLFKYFFELPNVFQETITYMESIKNNKDLCNFTQGDLWKEKIQKHSNNGNITIPFHLYFDDWEPDNALGSHKKLNSIAATYVIFPTIPPKYKSLLENILVVQLFKSMHKKFTDDQTYLNLLKQCIYIEKEGIELNIDGKKIKVFFMLGLILGDNLGIHEILGFATSFAANFNCIFCKAHKNLMHSMNRENSNLLRTVSQYNTDITNNEISSSGIKHECIFNKLQSFHAVQNFAVDIMHDIYEGVCNYDLSAILKYIIEEKAYITLNGFNEKKSLFDYGINDIGNISQPIEQKHIHNNKFNMSASEMRCFVNFFPLIIGELIPTEDEVWTFLLKLIQIIDIIESKSFNEEKLRLLQTLITEHHIFYVNFFKLNLKPKHHLMLHYPMIIRQSGPLINIWCMRAEGKHKELKAYSNSITSRVNLPYSIMMKQQLKFSYRLHSQRGFLNKIEIGPIAKESKILMDILKTKHSIISNNNSLVVKWIKINGNTYNPGLVANITLGANGAKKTIEIKHCISSENKDLFFIVFELNIEQFVSHYQSYKVNPSTSNNFIISIDQFLSRPVSKHTNNIGTFIRLKNE